MVKAIKNQIEQADIIMLMSSDLMSNVNVVRSEAAGVTDVNLFLAAADMFKSQLSAQLPNITFVSEPAVLSIGNYDAFVLEYTAETTGQSQYSAQYYVVSGDNLCVFTLSTTAKDAESVAYAFGLMLGTLTIN